MAWDDPVVWILMVGVVVLLFGSNKIPEIARYIGSAKKEFDLARRGLMDQVNIGLDDARNAPVSTPAKPPGLTNPGALRNSTASNSSPLSPQPSSSMNNTTDQVKESDPLLLAAKNEGIDTSGKTRSAIASELASKLKD